MSELIQAIVFLFAGVLAVSFFVAGYRVWAGDKREYDQNRLRVTSLVSAIRGTIPQSADGTRDSRVSAGLAVDLRTNEWIAQGRLSNESIAAALRKPQ